MITTIDPSLAVRGKIISALRSDAALTAICPNIYKAQTPAEPAWPFIRMGVPINTPFRADCGAGGQISLAVHCFTKGGDDPEAMAMTINAHVVRILDDMEGVALGGDTNLSIHVTQSQVMADGAEAAAFHGFVTIDALAL